MKSFYIIKFDDGTSLNSDMISWHAYAKKTKVSRRGKKSLVYASVVPIKSILVHHNGIEREIDIPEGCQVFQSTYSRTIFSGDKIRDEVVGRNFGLIKDGVVIEEYNISGETGTITGFKL